MYPESLQSSKHLLVCWCSDDSIADLKTVIAILKSGLPDTQLSLLTFLSLPSFSSPTYLSKIIVQNQTAFSAIIETLHHTRFDASLIFTSPGQSPYSMAYLCYLAGISIRIGQSQEFGGKVLSTCITPLSDSFTSIEHHLHLLKSLNIPIYPHSSIQINSFTRSIQHPIPNI